jgi:outer membrane protein OmpA-like peptidoglycan-associated protein
MRRSSGDPVQEFEELRRLLLSREREQLRDLRDRLSDKKRRSRDVAGVLPEAVKRSRERGDEMARALRPAVEGSIRESIETRPQTFIEALHPIIGPVVRRSIAESFRRLLRSLNRTFSWQGLKWRWEAWRTGKRFAEVVMLRSLVYRVEQVFLIHRETNRSLLHETADSAIAKDSDRVAKMLSAIQGFTRNAFKTGEDAALKEFRVGELQVWIAPGRYAYLAAVIRGDPPRALRITLEETIEVVHLLTGTALANFRGDPVIFEPFRTELEACLRSQSRVSKSSRGQQIITWTALGGVAAVLVGALLLAARSQAHWRDFLRRLSAQPGIVVTEARQGWFSPSQVTGLHDRSSVDPAGIAVAAKVDPKKVRFHWKEFLALDPASVRKRFVDRFGVPPGTEVTVTDGVLTLSGSAPYEWLEGVRREATFVPGVVSLVDRDANVIYNPTFVLKRFQEKFDFPKTVRVALVKTALILSGGAPHTWLIRVRSEGTSIPGISAVEERNLIDLDQRAFQQSKSAIENAFVYFLTDKDEIAPEGFAALSRLQEELRRCETAVERLDEAIVLEIDGFADSVADMAKNADLSQRRAQKVRDFLLSCGFDSARLLAVGMAAPGDAATPKQVEGHVAFKVSSSRVLLP